jgi:hypothetical protein
VNDLDEVDPIVSITPVSTLSNTSITDAVITITDDV